MRTIHGPKTRAQLRYRRHLRVRRKVSGTAERPRLVVYRSLKHIYAQLVDDIDGRTLAAADSREVGEAENRTEAARAVGELIARRASEAGKLLASRAKDAGIETVVFDRGGYRYHGKVKALAEGAREGGLHF